MIAKNVIDRCVICAQKLEEKGKLLVCPSGHYKVNAEVWEKRWQEFLKEIKDSGPIEANKSALLSDLRNLNQAET